MSVIEVKNVSKHYPIFTHKHHFFRLLFKKINPNRQVFTALNDISFSINRGKIVGIIGDNGSGKSTILKLITGISCPSSGEINVRGKLAAILELGSGFNPEYTGLENIYFQLNLNNLSKDDFATKVEDIINFSELEELIFQKVKFYSSGMFARLAFSVAIHVDADILIIDEALSVGDIKFQHKCLQALKKIVNNQVTVLFVSHSMETIRNLCDECIWLENGRVRLIGDAADLVDMYMQEKIGNNITNKAHQNFFKEVASIDEHEVFIKLNELQSISLAPVKLLDHMQNETLILRSGEIFSIKISIYANDNIENLNIGFIIRDKFGNNLLGESYFNKHKVSKIVKRDEIWTLNFTGEMLLKPNDSYSISIIFSQVSKLDRSDYTDLLHQHNVIIFECLPNDKDAMWFLFKQNFSLRDTIIRVD